jgi:putative oxidoreductase
VFAAYGREIFATPTAPLVDLGAPGEIRTPDPLPGAMLPLAIVTELAGAAAIIVGWNTRVVAFLLAGYSLVTAILFHSNFGDQIQMVMFLKNVSIAGGLLLLVANGAGPLSIDRREVR